MKTIKKVMVMMMAVLCVGMVMSSCSKDEDDQKQPGAAEMIAGSYTSDMTTTVMGQTVTFENITMKLTKKDDATVDLQVSGYGTAPMAVPSITIPNLKVTGTNNNYLIAETEFSGTNAETKKTYSGTINGSYVNGTLTINYSLKYGAMPMAMINKFVATKK